ncbi:uncharacterized protein [Nicotiana sylvestris]|uniref:uncharacterized protein n=1 Tax=Nicotiana sylvestris TaxID=4096 RepID=UPI00388CBB12
MDPIDDGQMQDSSTATTTQPQEKSSSYVGGIKAITLTDQEKERLHYPWKFYLIIKLFGKRIVHHYLKAKIQELWKPTEQFPLIDLGYDYYIVNFTQEKNMRNVLQIGHDAQQTVSAVWVRLPQLPTEFYDESLLRKIGNSIGSLLKIDGCTGATLRGWYARLCIQVPLEEPVTTQILIGSHLLQIIYEGEGFLCKLYGSLGHRRSICPYQEIKGHDQNKLTKDGTNNQHIINHVQEEKWQTILFGRKKRHNNRVKAKMEQAMTATHQEYPSPRYKR